MVLDTTLIIWPFLKGERGALCEERAFFRRAPDGICVYQGMGYGGRKAGPGFFGDLVGKRPAAVCGRASAPVGAWRREVYGGGRGVLTAHDRAGAGGTRDIAPGSGRRSDPTPWSGAKKKSGPTRPWNRI